MADLFLPDLRRLSIDDPVERRLLDIVVESQQQRPFEILRSEHVLMRVPLEVGDEDAKRALLRLERRGMILVSFDFGGCTLLTAAGLLASHAAGDVTQIVELALRFLQARIEVFDGSFSEFAANDVVEQDVTHGVSDDGWGLLPTVLGAFRMSNGVRSRSSNDGAPDGVFSVPSNLNEFRRLNGWEAVYRRARDFLNSKFKISDDFEARALRAALAEDCELVGLGTYVSFEAILDRLEAEWPELERVVERWDANKHVTRVNEHGDILLDRERCERALARFEPSRARTGRVADRATHAQILAQYDSALAALAEVQTSHVAEGQYFDRIVELEERAILLVGRIAPTLVSRFPSVRQAPQDRAMAPLWQRGQYELGLVRTNLRRQRDLVRAVVDGAAGESSIGAASRPGADATKTDALRVLYLTSNAEATEEVFAGADGSVTTSAMWLRTDAEVRKVRKELRGSKYRDLVRIELRSAAGPGDLLEGLNDVRPHIVHFSGHGGARALRMDNGSVEAPEGVHVPYETLGRLLGATDTPPTLLILNACDTLDGADELLKTVPIVIGMSESISDAAATIFASKFYGAIASGQSIGTALRQAKVMLEVERCSESHLPAARARNDVNIDELRLVGARHDR